jgi:hypothetical protein
MVYPPSVLSPSFELEIAVIRYGGCDYGTGEASFEEEACDQGSRTGVGSRRLDLLVCGGRIRVGRAGSRRAADDESCSWSGIHSRRRRNCRRQPCHVPSLRQRERRGGSGRRPARLGLPMRRLQRLQRLPCLPWLQSLPVRWLRGLRWLLPFVGSLPHLLSQGGFRLY